jgi:hypothetical protein
MKAALYLGTAALALAAAAAATFAPRARQQQEPQPRPIQRTPRQRPTLTIVARNPAPFLPAPKAPPARAPRQRIARSKPWKHTSKDYLAHRRRQQRELLEPHDYPSPHDCRCKEGVSRAHAFYAAALAQKRGLLPADMHDWIAARVLFKPDGEADVTFEQWGEKRGQRALLQSHCIAIRFLDWQPEPPKLEILPAA